LIGAFLAPTAFKYVNGITPANVIFISFVVFGSDSDVSPLMDGIVTVYARVIGTAVPVSVADAVFDDRLAYAPPPIFDATVFVKDSVRGFVDCGTA
jgi:hypothetical protein